MTVGDTMDLLRDDAACREAFRRGERWALERVYDTYAPAVRAVCQHGFSGFRGFPDGMDRDDAVQAVFAAAFEERSRLRYNGLDPYAAYLRGIARNVIRRMLESRARFERRPEPDGSGPPDLEAAVLHAEACAVVRRFRDGVTDPRERAVLQRYFCDGLAEERLAEELGLTRYRVRKIIARLHKRLTRHLREHGLDAP